MQQIEVNTINSDAASEKIEQNEPIRCKILESFESEPNIEKEWDDFMEEIKAEIFLTYDWCRIWWKYYGKGRDLKIFLFRKEGRIVGILPLFLEKVGIWPISAKVIKIVGTDYCPITLSIPLKKDILRELVACFLTEINHLWTWDIIYFGAICGKYDSLEELQQTFTHALINTHIVESHSTDVQTYFQIENTWEEQISKTLSQKQRNKTRREFKEIQSRNLMLTAVEATEENLDDFFEDFVTMHQKQWQSQGMPGHFLDWLYAYEFHKDLAQAQLAKDRLRLIQIKLGDEIIGYEYLYKNGQIYQWYLGARTGLENEQHLHFYRLAFKIKIESAIKDKVKSIDAGRGLYDYKIEMGGKLFDVHNIFIVPQDAIGRTRVKLFRRLVWAIHILYAKIYRRRIAPRIGMKPASAWRWWTKVHMLAS